MGMAACVNCEASPPRAGRHLTKTLEIFERPGVLLEPSKGRKELGELPVKARASYGDGANHPD